MQRECLYRHDSLHLIKQRYSWTIFTIMMLCSWCGELLPEFGIFLVTVGLTSLQKVRVYTAMYTQLGVVLIIILHEHIHRGELCLAVLLYKDNLNEWKDTLFSSLGKNRR